jgi:hypothetical protein
MKRSDVEVWLHHASLDELWPRFDQLKIQSVEQLRNLLPTEVLAIQRNLSSRPLAKLNQALLQLSETERTLGRLSLSKKLTALRRPAIPQRFAIRTSEAILTAAAQIEQLDHGHQEFHAYTADDGKVQFSPFRTKAIIRPNGPRGAVSSILSISPSHRKTPTPAEARGNLGQRPPQRQPRNKAHYQHETHDSTPISPKQRRRKSKNQKGHRRRRKKGAARKAAPVHIASQDMEGAQTMYESYLETRIRRMASELGRREAHDRAMDQHHCASQGNQHRGSSLGGESREAEHTEKAQPRFLISPAQPSPGDASHGGCSNSHSTPGKAAETPARQGSRLHSEAHLAAYLAHEKETLRLELLEELGLSSQQVQALGVQK